MRERVEGEGGFLIKGLLFQLTEGVNKAILNKTYLIAILVLNKPMKGKSFKEAREIDTAY